MSFELGTLTTAKLSDVVVLSQKNRAPDENPGAKLSLEMDLPSDALVHFDGLLRSFLFSPNTTAPQGALDGLATESLTTIGKKCGVLHWEQELTGYAFTIDYGTGGTSNINIADCTLSNWRIAPKEGGAIKLKFDVESADVSEAAFGKLAKLKSREIQVLLAAPVVNQAEIPTAPAQKPKRAGAKGSGIVDGSTEATKDAGQVFAEAHGEA